MFLHDIAKGRDEDHSIVGARIARKLGPRLGLRPDEIATVAWLIENHLVMSQFAQSRDLHDPKTIRDFANIVQSRELLMLLVILTAADIRAVGPGVWTGWKGQLLRQLYYETEPLLAGGHTSMPREARIRAAILEFRKAAPAWPQAEVDAFVARQHAAYWMRTPLAQQLIHADLMHRAKDQPTPFTFRIITDSFTAITELHLWTSDRSGLIAMIAGACAAAKANIVGASLSTTLDGMAINSFSLHRQFPDDREEVEFTARIAANIELALKGKRDLGKIISQKSRPRPRLEAFSVEPRVSIDNSLSDELTVIEVNGRDRTGLLYELACILTGLNIDISSAHIATFGEKAVDVFYVDRPHAEEDHTRGNPEDPARKAAERLRAGQRIRCGRCRKLTRLRLALAQKASYLREHETLSIDRHRQRLHRRQPCAWLRPRHADRRGARRRPGG